MIFGRQTLLFQKDKYMFKPEQIYYWHTIVGGESSRLLILVFGGLQLSAKLVEKGSLKDAEKSALEVCKGDKNEALEKLCSG